jgi:integrase
MMRAARSVVPSQWRAYCRLMRGLWLSGLRIGEAITLRWDAGNHPWIDLRDSGWLVIPAAADKAHRDRRLPLTPDFADWLRRKPQASGLVLSPGCTDNRACKAISMIGETAQVIVDPANGRTATAHDLRRAFAQRWASRLMPVDLQRLLRHGDIKTTLIYYTDADSDGLAARLSSFSGNSSGK